MRVVRHSVAREVLRYIHSSELISSAIFSIRVTSHCVSSSVFSPQRLLRVKDLNSARVMSEFAFMVVIREATLFTPFDSSLALDGVMALLMWVMSVSKSMVPWTMHRPQSGRW